MRVAASRLERRSCFCSRGSEAGAAILSVILVLQNQGSHIIRPAIAVPESRFADLFSRIFHSRRGCEDALTRHPHFGRSIKRSPSDHTTSFSLFVSHEGRRGRATVDVDADSSSRVYPFACLFHSGTQAVDEGCVCVCVRGKDVVSGLLLRSSSLASVSRRREKVQ